MEGSSEDMARYELESYVATHIRPSVSARQAGVIQKIASLPERSLRDLVSDVVNEIHRRNSTEHQPPETPMQRKLCRIHEEGFRNLVLDILLVADQRPDGKSVDDVEDVIEGLDRLVCSLREEVADEEKMAGQVYSESNIVQKTLLFARYTHYILGKMGEDTGLAEHMIEQLSKYSEHEVLDGFNLIFDPDAFLRRCDRLGCADPEYTYHRNNIRRLAASDLDAIMREGLVRQELGQIYAALARSAGGDSEYLQKKVHELVDVLCRIKRGICKTGAVDADVLDDVAEAIREVFVHIEKSGAAANISQLRAEIDLLEQIDRRKNNEDVLMIVFSAVDMIRRALQDMQQSS